MKTGCIYRFWYQDKSYIGKTTDWQKRLKHHFLMNGNCPYFHHALKKYGINAFSWEILEDNVIECNLSDREKYWIQHFNSVVPNGYNLTYGGDGATHCDETRKKISVINSGRIRSDEYKKEMSNTIKEKWNDPEYRQKVTNANIGKKHSDETKKKMSKSRSGENNHQYGKPHTLETRQKISNTLRGNTNKRGKRNIQKSHKSQLVINFKNRS